MVQVTPPVLSSSRLHACNWYLVWLQAAACQSSEQQSFLCNIFQDCCTQIYTFALKCAAILKDLFVSTCKDDPQPRANFQTWYFEHQSNLRQATRLPCELQKAYAMWTHCKPDGRKAGHNGGGLEGSSGGGGAKGVSYRGQGASHWGTVVG